MLKKQKARKHLILQAFLISVYLKQRIDAEREGFEPSVQLPVQRFSRPSHSTTLASLQKGGKNKQCLDSGKVAAPF